MIRGVQELQKVLEWSVATQTGKGKELTLGTEDAMLGRKETLFASRALPPRAHNSEPVEV